MLNSNNPFIFASSSAFDPLAPKDAVASAPGMPETFLWAHLLVTLVEVAPALPTEAPAPPNPAAAALIESPVESPVEAPVEAAPVATAVAPMAVVVQPVVVAPAPALVTIVEPAPLPAPSQIFVPPAMPADPAFDAYARLFQGIEDRDLLADLQATLAPGSDWANAFGPPLG